jgi:hypothetical protein
MSTPEPLAMPYPPATALLKDTHTAIKNLATAADTALASSATWTGYFPFTTNSIGEGSFTTDLKTVVGAVMTYCYGTGTPYPWSPVFQVGTNPGGGIVYFHAVQGMGAVWVGSGHACALAWGTR